MAKLTDEELKKREAKLFAKARSEISKTGIMQFRLDPENIGVLYDIAARKRVRVSAMLRDWVLERLQSEQTPEGGSVMDLRMSGISKLLNKSAAAENFLAQFPKLEARLSQVEKELQNLKAGKGQRQSSKSKSTK